MDNQEALDWAKRQDVVKVRAFKEDEKDKFTFVVGEYVVSPLIFDSQEEAIKYLNEHFKLTNMDLAIIGAMCQRLNEINNQQLKNEEK
jgi:hypothetical protein